MRHFLRTLPVAVLLGLAAPACFRAEAQPAPPVSQGASQGDSPGTSSAITPADQGWIARIQDTLNGIGTLKGRFAQIAPDGRRSTGTVWLHRPGRMRFEYDKPSPLLLVAGGGKLVFVDHSLGQTTDIPLDRTPLGLLLRPNLSLSGDVAVTGFGRGNGLLQVTLVKSAAPSDGSLTVFVSEQPLALRGWRVVDAQGRETTVDLFDVATGLSMPDSLFDTAAAENN